MKTKRRRILLVVLALPLAMALLGCPPGAGDDPDGAGDNPNGAEEGSLTIPGLAVIQWVTEPRSDVDHNQEGHVVILEFWATWCYYCVQASPHLNEIHRQFGDVVTVVAVTDESVSTIESFVASKGDAMQYAVAIDDNEQTWDAYMGAYGLGGIPHAFVLVDGEVVHHTHPMNLHHYALDDWLGADVIQERKDARQPVTLSGAQQYNGQPITDATSIVDTLEFDDTLFLDTVSHGNPAGVTHSYSEVTGTYIMTGLPEGSYDLTAVAGDGDRVYDPGNYIASQGGLSFTSDTTFDIDYVYSMHFTSPWNNTGTVPYPAAVPAGTATFTWDAVPGAASYEFTYYDYDLPGYLWYGEETAATSTEVTVASGHQYSFKVYAYNSSGERIGSTYAYTETSTGSESAYSAFVFTGQ